MSHSDELIISPPLEKILTDNGIDADGTKELVLMNDDTNSLEFAIMAIIEICNHSIPQATNLALQAHTTGTAVVLEGREETLKTKATEFVRRGFDAKVK